MMKQTKIRAAILVVLLALTSAVSFVYWPSQMKDPTSDPTTVQDEIETLETAKKTLEDWAQPYGRFIW